MKQKTFLFIITAYFFLLVFSPLLIGAQETEDVTKEENETYPLGSEEGEEAPEHIFDLDLGGVDTDIFWEGFWRYSLSYGTGYEIDSGEFIFPQAYPGLQQGLEFSQEPDFFLSVLLMNHYFLETSFTQGYDKNTYAMGYVGDESTSLKEVRIGNAGIGIGEYEGIDVSSPKYNTPGIMASFETTRSRHEIMVRYDPTEMETKEFLGEYEIDGETLELSSFQDGQNFILPNTNISNLTVYQQSSTGEYTGSDGRRYTSRDIAYTADLTDGFVNLQDASSGRVLVYYTQGGSPVGSSGISEDFIMTPDARGRPDPTEDLLPFGWDEENPYDLDGRDFRDSSLVTIDGHDALMVHNPGEFSNFQMYNRYLFYTNLPSESWRTIVSLVDSDGLSEDDLPYVYLRETDDLDRRILRVVLENTDNRSPDNRVPFAPGNPEVYGPGRVSDGDEISRELLIAVKKDSSNYYLGTNLIEGSVKVYVNGIEDKTAEVNYETGEVFFARYIFPEDSIEIDYRTESVGLTGGDLFLAQGNRLFLNDNMTVELAESLRWTLPEDQVTDEAGESPGLIELAGTWFYDTENLDMMVNTSLNISTSDTAGNLRLLGMDESGFSFSVTADQVVPSELSLTPNLTDTPDSQDREALIYKDFSSSNNTGQTYLNDYSWAGVSIDTSEEGPSIAASSSDDPFSSRVMVMSYDLDKEEWSAGDFLPVDSDMIDLSSYSELSFYLYRQNLGDDNLELKVRIGENGEYDDLDEDGSTDSGDSQYVIERDLTDQIPADAQTWEQVSILLTEEEQKKLSRVRSFRFILESTDSGRSEGELLVGGFRGEGSPLQMSVIDATDTERDAEDLDVREKSDTVLSQKFPEVLSIFHPDDEDQKVLELSWGTESTGGEALDSEDTISGTAWFNAVPVTDYGSFSLYVKNDSTQGTGSFSVTDSSGEGVIVEYEPGSTQWEKLTVDLQNGSAGFSGASRVTALTMDKDARDFSRFNMTRSGVPSASMEIDEVHFSDPTFSTGTSIETQVEYSKPGVIYTSAGGFPLMADFDVMSRFNYTNNTTDSYFNTDENRLESQLSSGIDLLNIRLQGDVEMVWTEDETLYSGGHLVRIPSQSRFGWVSDSYSRTFYPGDDTMARSNVIHLTPLPSLTLEAEGSSTASEDEIVQGWGGLLDIRPKSKSSMDFSFDLYQTSDWASDSTDYYTEWSRDFQYLKPLKEDISSREGLSALNVQRQSQVLGFSWETRLEYDALQQVIWQQENRWYSDLSFPIEISSSTRPWTITPGYRRELVQKVYPEQNTSFGDDLDTLFSVTASQFPLINFIPLYEIFGHDNMGDFERTLTMTDDSEYTPEAYIGFTRFSGSHYSDLFIPSSMDFAVQREYYKKDDTLYMENNWSIQVLQTALNLFGEWGRYPHFDFYATDEISSSLQLVMGGRDLWTPEPEEIVYQNYLTLKGESDWEIVLDNSYTQKWLSEYIQDDFQLIFRWFEQEQPYFNFPFMDYLVMKPSRMQHEEKLIFTGYFDQDDSTETSFDTTLMHESKLVITGLGSITGWMALGLGGQEEVFRNGFELGLELEMSF
jgi:hypothetical protein